MACYACEDCKLSVNNGGNCKYFEYTCEFTAVRYYDENKIKLIREMVDKLTEMNNELCKLDNEGCFGEIDSINRDLNRIKDQIDDYTIKEWNKINDKS